MMNARYENERIEKQLKLESLAEEIATELAERATELLEGLPDNEYDYARSFIKAEFERMF